MRQHEQTTDSTRRAWCWIILGITLAPSPVQAQSQAESAQPARSADPIDLAAGLDPDSGIRAPINGSCSRGRSPFSRAWKAYAPIKRSSGSLGPRREPVPCTGSTSTPRGRRSPSAALSPPARLSNHPGDG